MSERPILFSDAMVCALLEGRKTQTRRVVKKPGVDEATSGHYYPSLALAQFRSADGRDSVPIACPYGAPGDRLWVRESWALEDLPEDGEQLVWRADREAAWRESLSDRFYLASDYKPDRWRPSIHMPRWASRLLLEVTEVRVQRLQDLTEQDAKAEGARRFDDIPLSPYGTEARWSMESPTDTGSCLGTARFAFANYVNGLHGGPRWNLKDTPSLWDANPWVWAVSFRLVEGSR